MRIHLTVLALIAAGIASADVILPNGFGSTPGNGTFTLSTSAAAGRTYQFQIHQSQLASIVGHNVSGLQFRLNESIAADWPNVTTTYSDFTIRVGAGVDPALRSSTTFANFSGTPTLVRSGALVFGAGAFSSVGSPVKPFGPVVAFDTPFAYTGGHLTIEMRYSGHSGASSNPVMDASTSTTAGYGTLFAANWAPSATATTTSGGSPTANFFNVNLVSAPVPEPATMAALSVGVLALLRRRRK